MNYAAQIDDPEVRSLVNRELASLQRLTDRVLVGLLMVEWVAGVVIALTLSPLAWEGFASYPHQHVESALVLGGLLALFPCWLLITKANPVVTRLVVSACQMGFSALLVHLMAGRMEAHFHVFGSLAMLSFYRDRCVFVPAVAVITTDHLVRGLLWPESVFGVVTPSAWRALEHAGWVLFEVGFLVWGVGQSRGFISRMSLLQVELQRQHDRLADKVAERTAKITAERQLLDTIINSIPHAVFWKDRDSVYLGCNSVFAKAAGLPNPAAIVGLDDFDLPWTREESEWYRQCDRDVMVTGKEFINQEETQLDAEGRGRVLWTTKTPLRGTDGSVVGMVGLFADVTEKHQAHAERERLLRDVADRQALVEAILGAAADAIIVLDSSGVIVRANDSAHETFRVEPGSLPGQKINRFMNASNAVRHDGWLREATAGGPSDKLFAARHITAVRANGEPFAAELSASRMVVNGQVLFTGILRDVTERERLESQLSQARKLESIGQLAAGVAHEINTPMQYIEDNVEFLSQCAVRLVEVVDEYQRLLEGDEPCSWQERRERIQRIRVACRFDHVRAQLAPSLNETREGIDRVVAIIQAMKEFSHPGSTAATSIDLNATVQRAVALSRNHWKYVATLDLDLDPGLPLIDAYGSELSQVLVNLVVNAADAVAERYGEKPEEGRIVVRTSTVEGGVALEVQDNGTGVPESIRGRIFDPFFTTKEVGAGTGQGLALTHNVVVNQHGGSVEVNPTRGGGATFRVTLPLEPPEREHESITEAIEAFA